MVNHKPSNHDEHYADARRTIFQPVNEPGELLAQHSTLNHPNFVTILLVDDHAALRANTRAILARGGKYILFQVVGEAENGQVALELTDKLKPDLVLFDIQMPVMSGVDLARHLAKDHPDIKLMALTAQAPEVYEGLMKKIGVQAYLPKDTPARELRMAVEAVAAGGEIFYPNQTTTAAMTKSKPNNVQPEAVDVQQEQYQTTKKMKKIETLKERSRSLLLFYGKITIPALNVCGLVALILMAAGGNVAIFWLALALFAGGSVFSPAAVWCAKKGRLQLGGYLALGSSSAIMVMAEIIYGPYQPSIGIAFILVLLALFIADWVTVVAVAVSGVGAMLFVNLQAFIEPFYRPPFAVSSEVALWLNIYLWFIIMVVYTFLALYLFTKLNNSYAIALQKTAEVRAANSTILANTEKERSKISRDLHDDPLQQLVILTRSLGTMMSSYSQDPKLQNELLALQKETRQVADKLRVVCTDLRPDILEFAGLYEALKDLARQKRTALNDALAMLDKKDNNAPVEIVENLQPELDGKRYDPDLELVLYRVAQEALATLSNTLKLH